MGTFDYERLIAKIPDFPTEGVMFRDITPLLADGRGFAAVIDDIAEHFAGRGVTKVMGAEARGFMVGAPVAYRLGAGFVPARKPGKLARAVYRQQYDLEYGTDELEICKDSIGPDDTVLIVDDLIATGGTARAMVELTKQAGARLAGLGFLIELAGFDPRRIIAQATDAEFVSLVSVNER